MHHNTSSKTLTKPDAKQPQPPKIGRLGVASGLYLDTGNVAVRALKNDVDPRKKRHTYPHFEALETAY